MALKPRTVHSKAYFDESGNFITEGYFPTSRLLEILKEHLAVFLARLRSAGQSNLGGAAEVLWNRVWLIAFTINVRTLTDGTVVKEVDGIKVTTGRVPHLNSRPLAAAMNQLCWSVIRDSNGAFPVRVRADTVVCLKHILKELPLHAAQARLNEAIEGDSRGPGAGGRGRPRTPEQCERLVGDTIRKWEGRGRPLNLITRDAIADATGMAAGRVSRTNAWLALRERKAAQSPGRAARTSRISVDDKIATGDWSGVEQQQRREEQKPRRRR